MRTVIYCFLAQQVVQEQLVIDQELLLLMTQIILSYVHRLVSDLICEILLSNVSNLNTLIIYYIFKGAKTCAMCCESPEFNCDDDDKSPVDCELNKGKCKDTDWTDIMSQCEFVL